jgi:DNA end-binding protein Ku
MAARAFWQGQLRLALVSIPVEVYPATRSGAAISFHQIHEPSGKRIRYEKVAPGVGPIDREEIVKGYEVSRGNYVLLDDEEIESVRIESRKTLELVQFVGSDEIDVLYYEKPYFVVPADNLAEDAYIVLREALRKTRTVGLGQLSVRGREQLVSLKPCGRGLILEVLRYADEVQRAQNWFRDIPARDADPELLDLASSLIEKKTAKFTPDKFHDRYVDALHALIDKKVKAKGERIIEDPDAGEAPRGGNVIDLMAALKQSLGHDDEDEESGRPRKRAAAPRRKRA